ncbi:MAG TPA: ABC transporter permease [Bryobacteraceae bacterium]|jgi:predicted permease|nr:ABC transporter permease [Bryobacteraceae bacterium]
MYRALLHLYPKSFRGEYETEMQAVFSQRLRDASGFELLLLWIETFFDVLFNAIRVHLDILGQDLRYVGRTLRQSPGYALTVVAIAGLGIGATTAAYSITDHVLLRPLPFPDADRLVTIFETEPHYNRGELSPANYRDWKKQSKSFEAFGIYASLQVNLAGQGEPEALIGEIMTADVLPLLGVKPMRGRWFSAEDDRPGAACTVLLSYSLWQARFGGSASAIGSKVLLDDEPCTLIGVMPAGFAFPKREAEIWMAARLAEDPDRNNNYLVGTAKLAKGVTLAQANSELRVLAAQTERQFPKELKDVSAAAYNLRDAVTPSSKTMLIALLAASLCVLLIACTNLANLLLARALARRKELAVRSAMGAGRERLVRQLLTESLLLAIAGGALGMLIAVTATPLFAALVPTSLPIVALPSADWRVLSFGALATVLTGLAFGVLPALKATAGAGLREGSRSGVGGRKERLRGVLVVAEIAASVVLLVTSGLLIRAMLRIQGTDPGFRADGVLTLRTPVTGPRYQKTVPRHAFYKRVLEDMRVLPGVQSAAYTTSLPMVWRGGVWIIRVNGQEPANPSSQRASLRFVSPDFFRTLAIPLVLGRDVAESDVLTSPLVAVVSESFAKQYWPDQNPLGKQFNMAMADRTVIGVAGNVRVRGLEQYSEPQVYLPYQQVQDGWFVGYIPQNVAIRTAQDPSQIAPAVRAIIARAAPDLPVTNVQPLSEIVAGETASRRAQLVVLGGFAGIAFLLAAIGIHGLLAYAVSQRTQEIGVRMALGATRGNILRLIVGDAMVLALTGIAMGAALAYASGVELQSLLAGLRPNDLDAFSAGILLSLVMTIAGSALPAMRAIRIDPSTALRAE